VRNDNAPKPHRVDRKQATTLSSGGRSASSSKLSARQPPSIFSMMTADIHFHDVAKLLEVAQTHRTGNTMVVIEHNLK
jgi:excinuclease UvrABC ATPase subunit